MYKVGIIDYGMSNLLSITRGLGKVGGEVTIVSDPEDIKEVPKLVLPGVGAFPDGMKELKKRGFLHPIKEHVHNGKPFFGICLGMQMMLTKGFEIIETQGLDLIKGEVIHLPGETNNGKSNKVPHMGWNQILACNNDWTYSILQKNKPGDYVYFVHSYYAKLNNKENELSCTPFGDMYFSSSIHYNNCFGTQFHPEKSGELGLQILKEFLHLKY